MMMNQINNKGIIITKLSIRDQDIINLWMSKVNIPAAYLPYINPLMYL